MSCIEKGCEIFRDKIKEKSLLSRIIEEWEVAMNLESVDLKKNKYVFEPLVSIWTHVKENKKKLVPLRHFKSAIDILNSKYNKKILNEIVPGEHKFTLLETIIFNKPPQEASDLHLATE